MAPVNHNQIGTLVTARKVAARGSLVTKLEVGISEIFQSDLGR